MKRALGLIALCFVLVASNAQLSTKQRADMRKALLIHVNQLRLESGAKTLSPDKYLQSAAYMHSRYMAQTRRLSHKQRRRETKSALKRVHHAGGQDFLMIGENILYFGPVALTLSENDVEELALRMFNSWKDSKGHLENMLHPSFQYCDFDFKIDRRSRTIYATQVLGRR